jgi:25S rRNA (adenine2142-N1)-methyltransferase
MLRLTRAHLKPRGLLYLVLPLACVANSRFVDATRLRKILRIIGFEVLRQHDSAKLTYWLARWSGDERRDGRWAKQKIPDRQTGRRNNFAIVLK